MSQGDGLSQMNAEPMLNSPLTVKLSEICSGPRCPKRVHGKERYCSQQCRNDAYALRRVAVLLEGLSDEQALRIIRPQP